MTKAEELYSEIGQSFKESEQSQMFGKPCFKISAKAFICFFKECMVFKLSGDEHAAALALKGAELFDPSGKKRPMKEWVQVPYAHAAKWKQLAKPAHDYVKKHAA